MRAGLREDLEGFFSNFFLACQRQAFGFLFFVSHFSVFLLVLGPNTGVRFLGADFTTTIPLLRTNAAHDIFCITGSFSNGHMD